METREQAAGNRELELQAGFSGRIARRMIYAQAEPFLFELRRQYTRGALTWQQARTLKGQALSGDLYGAKKGLMKLVSEGAQTHAETPEAVE